jgi:hypothetical protein
VGQVSGSIRTFLRLEGLAVLGLSVAAYALWSQEGWALFALLFLAPDLSMLGYLRDPRFGAVVYNVVHTYLGPALLGALAVCWSAGVWLAVALIWSAHIGFDRMLGYGLKLPTSFQATHLGSIGRTRVAKA